jgi:hypothetical protein
LGDPPHGGRGGRDLKVWSGGSDLEKVAMEECDRRNDGKRKFRKGNQKNCRVNKEEWRNGRRSDRNEIGRSKSRE